MGAFDANGMKLTGDKPVIETSLGGAYDRKRMVLAFELEELSFNNVPKTEKVNQQRSVEVAADEALSFIDAQINKIPQPSWVADPKQFKNVLSQVLEYSAKANHVSKGDVMSAAKGNYNGEHRLPTVAEVPQKIKEIQSKISDMDGLVDRIDAKFGRLVEAAQTPEELRILSKTLGFKNISDRDRLTIDAIYAVDPGFFQPKDQNGKPVKYEPGDIKHVLHAIEYMLDHPAKAMSEGMRMFDAHAISELRRLTNEMDSRSPGLGNHLQAGNMSGSANSSIAPRAPAASGMPSPTPAVPG